MTDDAIALPPTDAGHLRTLSILHYVNAGLSLFALVVIALQAAMLAWMETLPGDKPPGGMEQMWAMFVVVWVGIGVFAVAMAALHLSRDLPTHDLACNLRRAFSGLVSGNAKEDGIRAVEQRGPFELSGEQSIIGALDELLRQFVAQGRMRLSGRLYTPCYRLAG